MKMDAWKIAFDEMLNHDVHNSILEMLPLMLLSTWQIAIECILLFLLELTISIQSFDVHPDKTQ